MKINILPQRIQRKLILSVLCGKFVFKGDYAVADAVRVISYGEKEVTTEIAENFTQNSLNVNCFPNPFTSQTRIEFQLLKSENVKLQIINNQGQTVEILTNQVLPEGNYSFVFDGSKLAKGLYFFKLQTNSTLEKGKLILN